MGRLELDPSTPAASQVTLTQSVSSTAFRFQYQDPIVVDGEVTYGLWNPPWFISKPELLAPRQVSNYKVNAGEAGRPDLIASILYGTSYLDWVLIAFNRPRNPFNWPNPGDVIKVPSSAMIIPFIN